MPIKFKVEGMSCMHCVRTLEKALQSAGISSFKVEIGKIEIYDVEPLPNPNKIKEIVEDAGYKVINE